jgi:hypothetical protein
VQVVVFASRRRTPRLPVSSCVPRQRFLHGWQEGMAHEGNDLATLTSQTRRDSPPGRSGHRRGQALLGQGSSGRHDDRGRKSYTLRGKHGYRHMGWLLCQWGFGNLPTYTGALVSQVFFGCIPPLETWHPPLLSYDKSGANVGYLLAWRPARLRRAPLPRTDRRLKEAFQR